MVSASGDRLPPGNVLPDQPHTRLATPATLASTPGLPAGLVARLGLFDATMVVMGGIIGSGIFINPYVVATLVHTPVLILGAWGAGGAIALLGAFIYAELADRMPKVGGQYAYLSAAFHPAVGFLYGWVSLLVIGAGGTAAVAVTFAKYFGQLTHLAIPENVAAVAVVVALVAINCMGVRAGSGLQSLFMVLRIFAVTMIVVGGAWFIARASGASHTAWHPAADRPVSLGLLSVFGASMIPVLFAYGGWQTANFIAGEIREPRKTLARALLLGVLGVISLYVSVNFIYVQALTPAGLASTATPASEVMGRAFGDWGAWLIAIAVVISTVGFLSQSTLTYPRLYFAMASDGVLPARFARLAKRSRAPVGAIVLQGCVTIAVVLLGTYEQILSYVVVMDWLFFCLTAASLFIFRKRDRRNSGVGLDADVGYRVPGHPWSTGIFTAIAGWIVVNTIYKYPRNAGVAVCILFAGLPFYFLVRWRAQRPADSERISHESSTPGYPFRIY
ncbi:MAG TPA: amino acid permease [Candidatus Limnocylindria bacterium]|nr:amino acid permease [Candidatus Limnocylindria bacterium]